MPRFLMITGIAVLGLVYFSPEVKAMFAEMLAAGKDPKFDFEKIELLKAKDEGVYDPQEKRKRAKFGKPGIYVE